MGRGRNYLVAIALALGLTSAQAQTAPHESLGPKGVLTAERQKLLLEAVATQGKNFSVGAPVATALGINESEAVNLRQIATKDKISTAIHVFVPLSDGGV